ncbi:MAG: phosphoglycolate phosphatase [Pseudomonadota bacterium]
MQKRKMRSATIDLDGTLLDTVADLAAACNAMLLALNRPARSLSEVRGFVGRGAVNLVSSCLNGGLPASEVDPVLLARALASFRAHYLSCNGRSSEIYPGVIEGLNALREAKIALACVTNKPSAFSQTLLERMGLAVYFSVVVSGDTLPQQKPHPAPILHACQLLGTSPAQNVHIGDSLTDIAAARGAGCLAVAVNYGYSGSSRLNSADCDVLISSLAEVRLLPQFVGAV